MNPMSFHRLRGNLKALFAALGVGVLTTMGALTNSCLADPCRQHQPRSLEGRHYPHADGATDASLRCPDAQILVLR